ncbi:MAG: MBL fold metallo-hydrolase [Bacteroidales bacterium]|nr:MBL fold metallo-hydrolase [Bacteroidales bacterium]
MEKVTMLGTGAAMVTTCYNTCFTLSDDDGEHFLVDGGGGNGIIAQLKKAEISISQIHNAFISHNHTDHILGMVWVIRYICQEVNKGRYEGNLTIYGHKKSVDALRTISGLVLQPKQQKLIDERICFHEIEHDTQLTIGDRAFHFFNIWSKKELQHGFTVTLHDGRRLAFLGDEPYNVNNEDIIKGSDIIMQEAYCLHSEVDKYNPYPKSHGTVMDSCKNAQALGASTTILFHTEGRTPMTDRKRLYTSEGQAYFNGRLLVPDDLEVIEL